MVDSNKQGRSRVLRAEDIVPPYNRDIGRENNQSKQPTEQLSEPQAAKHQDGGIPQFDLAEQILAEKRKIAGTKRKRAVDVTKAIDQRQTDHSIETAPELPPTAMPLQEQVIAQIVARDIQRLTDRAWKKG